MKQEDGMSLEITSSSPYHYVGGPALRVAGDRVLMNFDATKQPEIMSMEIPAVSQAFSLALEEIVEEQPVLINPDAKTESEISSPEIAESSKACSAALGGIIEENEEEENEVAYLPIYQPYDHLRASRWQSQGREAGGVIQESREDAATLPWQCGRRQGRHFMWI